MTRILQIAWHSPLRETVLAALPVAGMSGTLHSRFTQPPLRAAVYAKTGSTNHARLLAGYARTPRGRWITFALMINDWMDDSAQADPRTRRGASGSADGAAYASRSSSQAFIECMESTTHTATFAAGCFWGVESAFRQIRGVIDAVSGYCGGTTEHPTYRDVCGHRTGHAEAVEVTYDPALVTYAQLLNAFWSMHDPTQLNRQGPDVGDQYRSAIFTHSGDQLREATQSRDAQQSNYRRPIVTQIEPASTFWRAEEYHQRYFERNGGACHIAPAVTP